MSTTEQPDPGREPVAPTDDEPMATPAGAAPTDPADVPRANPLDNPSEATEVDQPLDEQPSEGDSVSSDAIANAKIGELEELITERTADLQRLQAEYANYKKRVDRDRALARLGGIEAVVLDLLPVLDSIEAAREHDELTGGFKLVAEELERLSAKYGLNVYGAVGEPFDPNVHEALMHVPMEGVEVATVSAIMQKGVMLNDRVLRPARVGVAEPE